MKAAVLNKKNEDLEIKEVPMPEIDEDDVLVKVKYAGVNPLDNMIVREEVKLITPYKYPLVMGNEFSGIVEKTGGGVADFTEGDRVYARMPLNKIGAFAEYVAINKYAIAKIPDYLKFDEAACVPLTALTAIQAFELMNPSKGERIFISGGTGSLGAMAIPIAKDLGLHIITSGSEKNRQRVMDLGVSEFIDYKTEDYSEILSDVDYVLDTLGESELEKEFKILKPGGILVSLKGLPNEEFAKRMELSTVK
jgi:NADPH:quinone reductase-like Zn-dependent oxidoreductase